MSEDQITAVGIDVSKRYSMVAIRRPGGIIVRSPFKVEHDVPGLNELIRILKQTDGEIRIVMEHTGSYWYPIARVLNAAGYYVSVVNAILIHKFSDNSLRKVKTDRADALKIANYALTFWGKLQEYTPEDETRLLLKTQCRLYERTTDAGVVLRNGLITLLDQTFPGANNLFSTTYRNASGRVKWVDFVYRFWHRDCVAGMTQKAFTETFCKWCKRSGYRFSVSDADHIYRSAKAAVAILPKTESSKALITHAVESLNTIYDSLQAMRNEMDRLARLLPEYEVVMSMNCVGPVTGPQLIAEIGDVRRFNSKAALVAYAGVDASPYQSGSFDAKSCHISKRGSARLRRTVFMICSAILQNSNPEDPVFLFMDKKRSEGKHFYVYMIAGTAKFLRICYARVTQFLEAAEAYSA